MTRPAGASAPVADGEPPPPSPKITANNQILFKRHKTLPRPRNDTSDANLNVPHLRAVRKKHGLPQAAAASSSSGGSCTDETGASHSKPSSPHTSKDTPRPVGNGPRLPPTPPAHSRNSSSTYPALPSTATYVQSPEQSAEDVQRKADALPATPTQQMSPPTPDVTPPQALQLEIRPKGPPHRPLLRDQSTSKGTESRAESFKTAREDLSSSSDDEAAQENPRPAPDLARISESTLRQLDNGDAQPAKRGQTRAVGLGLGLESSPDSSLASQSKRHFMSFDGEWGAGREELAKTQNGNASTRVVAPTRQRTRRNATNPARVVEDFIITPTNATMAARSMSLPQRILRFPSPVEGGSRSVLDDPPSTQQPPRSNQIFHHKQGQDQQLATAAPILANMAPSADPLASDSIKRSSTASSRSAVSTVVEAVLIASPPQRQRTLRHVQKRSGLRDSGLDLSPTSSGTISLADETARKRRPIEGRSHSSAHENALSTITCNSLSSRSARREVWKAGGIPVVVVPNRVSSATSTSRTPSLRSTSSRRSKRTQSLRSVPISQISRSREISPAVDQRSRRGRTMSERGGSSRDGSARGDQRTMDYPPIVPRRTSSLSAPTSRNPSRSASLTAESIHACAAILPTSLREPNKTASIADSLDGGQAPSQASSQSRGSHPPSQVSETRSSKSAARAQSSKTSQPAGLELFVEGNPVRDTQAAAAATPKMQDLFSDHTAASNSDNRVLLDPRPSLDRHGDRNASTLMPPNTPFSVVSVETVASHHSRTEVSEALAVNIYAHQNTSVFVVNNSSRPSNCSDDSRHDLSANHTETSTPKQGTSPVLGSASVIVPRPSVSETRLRTTASGRGLVNEGGAAAAPSQQLLSPDGGDMPRQPPAIDFPPATPSGLTPPNQKNQDQKANLAEEEATGRPSRRNVTGVLRRALSRGRTATRDHGPSASGNATTEYGPSASRSAGIFTRTLSLTRDVQRRARSLRRSDSVDRAKGTTVDDEPVEEDRLHPSRQPGFPYQDADNQEAAHHYPPTENRRYPPSARRSMSLRMKETFASLPLDPNGAHPAKTERRTVRRTPSGNLRVVKHHSLAESLKARSSPTAEVQRPYTAPGDQGSKSRVWRSLSLTRGKGRENGRDDGENAGNAGSGQGTDGEKRTKILPNIGDKLGELGPHTITRRFSERRREKRINELRQMISAPQEVRDGVGEVIRRTNYRDAFTQAQTN